MQRWLTMTILLGMASAHTFGCAHERFPDCDACSTDGSVRDVARDAHGTIGSGTTGADVLDVQDVQAQQDRDGDADAEQPTRCPTGQVRCDQGCTDVSSDSANCSACGASCRPGDVCSGGLCQASVSDAGDARCPTGQTLCGTSCKALASDSANCGACGHACPTGETCSGGSCQTTNGSPQPCGSTQSSVGVSESYQCIPNAGGGTWTCTCTIAGQTVSTCAATDATACVWPACCPF